MCSPDGGRRDRDSAEQILGDVRRMVCTLDIKQKLDLLLDSKFLRENYLNNPKRIKGDPELSLRASSVRKYLKSFVVFLTFVIIDHVKIDKDTDSLDVTNLKAKVCNWIKSYNGEEKEQVSI